MPEQFTAACGATRDVLPCVLDADHHDAYHQDVYGYRWPTAAAVRQAAEDLRPAGMAALLAHVAAQLPPDDPEQCARTLANMTTPEQRAAAEAEQPTAPRPADDGRLILLDGRDALAAVIIRPVDGDPDSIAIEANARGMSKAVAAYALRQTADQFDAAAIAEGDTPITPDESAAERAQRAADMQTTAQVFAGLHRSAEETVTRVIALAERWAHTSDRKDGPLRELRTALGVSSTPADQPAEH